MCQQKHLCPIPQASSSNEILDALNYTSILAERWKYIKEEDLPKSEDLPPVSVFTGRWPKLPLSYRIAC